MFPPTFNNGICFHNRWRLFGGGRVCREGVPGGVGDVIPRNRPALLFQASLPQYESPPGKGKPHRGLLFPLCQPFILDTL